MLLKWHNIFLVGADPYEKNIVFGNNQYRIRSR